MSSRKWPFALYLVVVVACILFVAELTSLQVNRSEGAELPFFFGEGRSVESFRGRRFMALDPHLGYAYSDGEALVEAFRSRHGWYRGFAIYSDRPLDQLIHPVILTLGGSTTDAIQKPETSWPEELAKVLAEKGIAGTVVNGAAGGYSSNQELLKLIRGGLELRPDLVISYSGVNDRGHYGSLPHPRVHRYQRELLATQTEPSTSPLVPNTIYLLRNLAGPGREERLSYTLGLETTRSMGEWYARNLSLMRAVSRASGAEFLAVVQPNAYVGGEVGRDEWAADPEEGGKPAHYVDQLRSLYAEIEKIPERTDYVHLFTAIFEGREEVYLGDGVHTTPKGDRIIAENIFELITTETPLLSER